jgi:hypothetical protein
MLCICEFNVAGRTYEVFECCMTVSRLRNQEEEAVFLTRADEIELILKGGDDGTLGAWLVDTTQLQDGNITFRFPGQNAKDQVIDFEGGRLLTFVEFFTPGKLPPALLTPPTNYYCLDVHGGKAANKSQKRTLARLLSNQQQNGLEYCMLIKIWLEK